MKIKVMIVASICNTKQNLTNTQKQKLIYKEYNKNNYKANLNNNMKIFECYNIIEECLD